MSTLVSPRFQASSLLIHNCKKCQRFALKTKGNEIPLKSLLKTTKALLLTYFKCLRWGGWVTTVHHPSKTKINGAYTVEHCWLSRQRERVLEGLASIIKGCAQNLWAERVMRLIQTTRRPEDAILPLTCKRTGNIWHTHSLIHNHGFNWCLYINVKISRRGAPFSLFNPYFQPPQLVSIIDIQVSRTKLHPSHKLSVFFLWVSGSTIWTRKPRYYLWLSLSSNTQSVARSIDF